MGEGRGGEKGRKKALDYREKDTMRKCSPKSPPTEDVRGGWRASSDQIMEENIFRYENLILSLLFGRLIDWRSTTKKGARDTPKCCVN